ncbi:MAG: prepilin peptidase [Rhodoferax sp.]|nr:prepilin peptidase [Rhodoferax sp.]
MLVSTAFDAGLLGLVGLLIGSFLNVVIHRLPMMIEAQERRACAELAGETLPAGEPFNLSVPRSRCPACGHAITWRENIPVLSYLVLKGRCSACSTRISPRYPLVELVTGALFLYCGLRWGATPVALGWSGFCACLVALTLIDWDTTLLPDDLTLPLVWCGLLLATLGWTGTGPADAVWGAAAGYVSLWLVNASFKWVKGESHPAYPIWDVSWWLHRHSTGQDGMGYGDFKLYAALGAWFGWQGLIPIILMAAVLGSVVGIALKFSNGLREGGYVPFGPFLAGAGLTALMAGPAAMLRAIGL